MISKLNKRVQFTMNKEQLKKLQIWLNENNITMTRYINSLISADMIKNIIKEEK